MKKQKTQLRKEEKNAIILPSAGIIIAIVILSISTYLHMLTQHYALIGFSCLIVTLTFTFFGGYFLWKTRKRYGRNPAIKVFCYSFSLLFLIGGFFTLIYVLIISCLGCFFTENALSTLLCSLVTIVISLTLWLGGRHYEKK